MAQLAVFIAGLLLFMESQASDVAEADDSSIVQGFLSKREKKQTLKGDQFASSGHSFAHKDFKASDAMKSKGAFFDSEKFIVPTFSDVQHENGPDAVSRHDYLAQYSPSADEGASPFRIIDDKPDLHLALHVQDAYALTSANGKPAIATKEEEKAAQKLFTNGENTPMALYAVSVGLFALVMMLRVRIRRGLRPATILASNDALVSDMFTKMVPGLVDNNVEMKSHTSSSLNAAFGEGISDSQSSEVCAQYLCDAQFTHGLFAMLAALGFPVTTSWALISNRVSDDLKWNPLNLLPSDTTARWQPVVFAVDPSSSNDKAGAGRVNALWLRSDLRLDDNPALLAACEKADSMLPIFVFDPANFKTETLGGSWKSSARRARFLLESVACMRKKLEKKGSGLAVVLGKASEAVPHLAGQCNDVFVTQGVCSEETIAEHKVEKSLKTNDTKLNRVWGGTLYFPNECGCDPKDVPLLFTSFKNEAESKGTIRKPRAPPAKIPPVPEQDEFKAALEFMPSLQELGYSKEEADDAMKDDPRGVMPFVGGEDAALERVKKWIFSDDQLQYYFDIRNGMVGEGYSSKFSPWLATGCISPRRVWAEVKRYEQFRVKNKSTYWLIFELTWRDFFLYMGNSYGDKLFLPGGITGEKKWWSGGEANLKRWKDGRTGDKLVDANMRELALTGFMSNRGRQNVASYLIFDLNVDWRFGAAHFEEHLLDYDPCSNWGNWVAAAGLTGQRVNKFNTKKQLSNYDPNREYVDLWLKGRPDGPMVYDDDASSKNQKGRGKGNGKQKEYDKGHQKDRRTRRFQKRY